MATPAVSLENRNPLKKEDVTCPICWSVLIEPVTLPCKHNLCLVCYKKHIDETALTCPCCRKRLSVWSRKANKENCLVNLVFWERIQREFPKLVCARLNNENSEDLDSNDLISTKDANFDVKGESLTELDGLMYSPPPKRDGECAAQGEIRQEFEYIYKSHLEDLENQRKREADASSEFIRKIQEEETQQEAEEKSKLEADFEYAKRIQMEEEEEARLKALAVSKSLQVEKETLCRNLLSGWGPSLTSPKIKTPSAEKTTNQLLKTSHKSSSSSLKRRSSSASSHSNESKSIKRNGKNSNQPSILNFVTNSQDLDTSTKSRMETTKSSVDLSNSLLDTPQFSPPQSPQSPTSTAAIPEINANKNLTSSFVIVGLVSSGSTASAFKPIFTSPKSRLDLNSNLSPVKSVSCETFTEQQNIPGGKYTPDSIHVALNSHFRPIKSCPKIPSYFAEDGTYQLEPKVTVGEPTHNSNSVYEEVTEESEMDISHSKDSITPCSVSSSQESEYYPYRGLRMDDVDLGTNLYPSGDPNSQIDSYICNDPLQGEALEELRAAGGRLKAIIESNDDERPDSPIIMPGHYEYEAEEVERFCMKKEQEFADYQLALALENQLNRRPSPVARSKNSKERYSIRNWLKKADSSQTSTSSASCSKSESSISTKDEQFLSVEANNVAISSANITIRKEILTSHKEAYLQNGNNTATSSLVDAASSHNVDNNLPP